MKKLSIALVAILSIGILTSCSKGEVESKVNNTTSEIEAVVESTIAELKQESEQEEPAEPEPQVLPTFGDTFETNGFKVTIGDALGDFKKVDNKYSEHHGKDVVTLPMTIENISGQKNLFNPLFVKTFAPDGVQARYFGILFSQEDVFSVGDMLDGGKVETKFHFEYRGDGDYKLEFASATDYTVVNIPVIKQ